MGRGAWQAAVPGVTESQTRLSNCNFHTFITHYLCSFLDTMVRALSFMESYEVTRGGREKKKSHPNKVNK